MIVAEQRIPLAGWHVPAPVAVAPDIMHRCPLAAVFWTRSRCGHIVRWNFTTIGAMTMIKMTTTEEVTADLRAALRVAGSRARLARLIAARWRPVPASSLRKWLAAPWSCPYGAVLACKDIHQATTSNTTQASPSARKARAS